MRLLNTCGLPACDSSLVIASKLASCWPTLEGEAHLCTAAGELCGASAARTRRHLDKQIILTLSSQFPLRTTVAALLQCAAYFG